MSPLEVLFASLYKSPDDARRVLLGIGLNPADVDFSGPSKGFWFRSLSHALSHGKLEALLDFAAGEFPAQRAALLDALPSFRKRASSVGTPYVPSSLFLGLLTVVGLSCVAIVASVGLSSRLNPDARSNAEIIRSLGQLRDNATELITEIGFLQGSKDQMEKQLHEKGDQIDGLKAVTTSLERDLAELRRRQDNGTIPVDQVRMMARIEAAIASNEAVVRAAEGHLDQSLESLQDALAKLRNLSAAGDDRMVQEEIGRNLINQAAIQGATDRRQEATKSLKEADQVVQSLPDAQQARRAIEATRSALGAEPAGSPPQISKRDERQQRPSVTTPNPAAESAESQLTLISYRPQVLPSLRVETFKLGVEIGQLWLPRAGEREGRVIEPAGKVSAVNPGKYDLMCNTKGRGQLLLVEDLEVRPGQQTIVRPQVLMGTIQIDPVSRPALPKLKSLRLISTKKGREGISCEIIGDPKELGAPIPMVQGFYDLRATTDMDDKFVLQKGLLIEPGKHCVVKPDDLIAAFVVPSKAVDGLEFHRICVLESGSDRIIQESKTAGRAMPVYAPATYDVILEQTSGTVILKQNVSPRRGELTEVP